MDCKQWGLLVLCHVCGNTKKKKRERAKACDEVRDRGGGEAPPPWFISSCVQSFLLRESTAGGSLTVEQDSLNSCSVHLPAHQDVVVVGLPAKTRPSLYFTLWS